MIVQILTTQQFVVQTFEFISTHLQVIGWPALCVSAWKISRVFTKAEERILTAEGHITKMATNCFPTMQTSLQNQDSLLKSMDESLKTISKNTVKPKRRKT